MSETTSSCPFGYGADGKIAPGFTHAAITPALSRDKLPTLLATPVVVGEGGHQTGRCLCGRVSFKLLRPVVHVLASHDAAARRWGGGIALTTKVRASETAFHGWGNIVHYGQDGRTTHGFCRNCGSSLFVRHLAPAEMDGFLSLMIGALDSHDGMALVGETHIDEKPALYALAGDRPTMTSAEVAALEGAAPSHAAE